MDQEKLMFELLEKFKTLKDDDELVFGLLKDDEPIYCINFLMLKLTMLYLRQSEIGSRTSETKKKSSAENGKLGGRPKKLKASDIF